jgi:hypothetical protein
MLTCSVDVRLAGLPANGGNPGRAGVRLTAKGTGMPSEPKLWTLFGVALALAGAAIPLSGSRSTQDPAPVAEISDPLLATDRSRIPLSSFNSPGVGSSEAGQAAAQRVAYEGGDFGWDDEAEPAYEEPIEDEPVVMYLNPEQSRDPEVFLSLVGPGDSNTDPWSLSDQQVMDAFLAVLNSDQRIAFRAMWGTMSPDERQGFLQELRFSL